MNANPNGTISQVPWTGGKPSDMWDSTLSTEPKTPYCYRPTGTTDQLRIHTVITKGLDRKFGFGDSTYSLNAFSSAVWTHLKECGLDSIFYFPLLGTTSSTGTMVDIISKHSRFLFSDIRDTITLKKVTGTQNSYDSYNLRNLASARTFLFQSLTSELQTVLEQKTTDDTTGPELWMLIIEETQSDSTRRHQCVKDQLRNLRLTAFPAENVRLFNQKCVTLFRELENADALDDDLLLCLLEAYTKCATETFRVSFITQCRDLELYLCTIKGKSPSARKSILGVRVFTYSSLMEDALSLYNSLFESGDWTAAVTTKQDKHGVVSAFSNHEANLLISSPSSFPKRPITCFNCGGQGHMSCECPKPKKPQSTVSTTQKPSHSGGRGDCGRGRPGNSTQGCGSLSGNRRVWPDWQTKPPLAGKPEIRDFNGTTFYWCSICKHWRTTHSTNGIPGDNVPRHTNVTRSNTNSAPVLAGNYAATGEDTDFDW